MNTNDEKIMIDKYEYENLKKQDNEYRELMSSDFAIKVYRGAVLHPNHPNYNNNRIEMKMFSIDFTTLNNYFIQIDGKEYNIKSQNLFNKIKKFVVDNLDVLISCSKSQTNKNLDENAYEGGVASSILIKYGQLVININGQTMNLREICNQFIDELKKMIIDEGEKTQEDYMMKLFEKNETYEPTPLDKEFDKYSKLYEERFGKKAYIPEPSGTKEFAIECIKKCLDENKDMLDDLYYPNFKKDMENGVLYSKAKTDLTNYNFSEKDGVSTMTDEKLKTIIQEIISNNKEMIGNDDTYLNTLVYDIMKKIVDLPSETTTTIANLINYNPDEKFVEPLLQGTINFLVNEVCKNLDIKLERNKDKIGGLAYYNEFKKVDSDKL